MRASQEPSSAFARQVSTQTIKMLKDRETHFRNVEDVNEKFGSTLLMQPMYRYGTSRLFRCLAQGYTHYLNSIPIVLSQEQARNHALR